MADIENFIDAVMNQDFTNAGPMFNDLLGDKLNDALEQEKIAVASSIFNEVEDEEQLEMDFEEEELDDDIEISDEEMDDAIYDTAEEEFDEE